jgi:hypothetical protein
MSKENSNYPKPGDKGVYVVNNKSSLQADDGFRGKEKYGYGKIDIKNAPDVSKEEFNSMLLEERNLRMQLRRVDIWQKTAEEVAQLMKENGLGAILQEWLSAHMRNKDMQMKRGDSNVIIVPSTQILIEAAKLLQH